MKAVSKNQNVFMCGFMTKDSMRMYVELKKKMMPNKHRSCVACGELGKRASLWLYLYCSKDLGGPAYVCIHCLYQKIGFYPDYARILKKSRQCPWCGDEKKVIEFSTKYIEKNHVSHSTKVCLKCMFGVDHDKDCDLNSDINSSEGKTMFSSGCEKPGPEIGFFNSQDKLEEDLKKESWFLKEGCKQHSGMTVKLSNNQNHRMVCPHTNEGLKPNAWIKLYCYEDIIISGCTKYWCDLCVYEKTGLQITGEYPNFVRMLKKPRECVVCREVRKVIAIVEDFKTDRYAYVCVDCFWNHKDIKVKGGNP